MSFNLFTHFHIFYLKTFYFLIIVSTKTSITKKINSKLKKKKM